MPEILMYLPFFMILGVVGIFAFIYSASLDKLPEEANLKPILEFQVGGYFGNVSWLGSSYKGPFIRVSFYENFFVLSTTKKYLFRYTDVSKWEANNILLSNRLHIHHNREDCPKNIWLRLAPEKQDQILALVNRKKSSF